METEYFTHLSKCLEESGLDTVYPNQEILKETLSLDGSTLSSLSSQKISTMIFTLSRYQLYIQLQYNIRSVRCRKAKRDFEMELGKALVNYKGQAKATIKEKTAQVLLETPYLLKLEEDMIRSEGEETLFHKIPEMVIELTNALKKELSIRGSGQ